MSVRTVHIALALAALLPLCTLGVLYADSGSGSVQVVEIGIEHTEDAKVALSHSRHGTVHLADIHNEGIDTIHMSVPESWVRGEVKWMQLKDLVVEPPEFGFKRYSIPGGGMVSFSMPTDIGNLSVFNASKSPLRMSIRTINLETNATDTEQYLIDDSPLHLSF